MSLSTYLFFDGTCAEAFERYREVFGSDYTIRMTFADAPEEAVGDDADLEKIMHVSLSVGSAVLMGSDVATGYPAPVSSNSFAVHFTAETQAEADRIFDALAVGGEVTMPMGQTFWGAYFGMCKDRFGVSWMVDYEAPG